ncbi:unnamed protein product [Anisakis simplex]|uniref:RUN domain-containing protein n=1 Tax=Anisakis simplex TaxID=6269 RepID=A0A0M3KAG8_ANISI|nr:unnamed protein product [Anisakis simplex]
MQFEIADVKKKQQSIQTVDHLLEEVSEKIKFCEVLKEQEDIGQYVESVPRLFDEPYYSSSFIEIKPEEFEGYDRDLTRAQHQHTHQPNQQYQSSDFGLTSERNIDSEVQICDSSSIVAKNHFRRKQQKLRTNRLKLVNVSCYIRDQFNSRHEWSPLYLRRYQDMLLLAVSDVPLPLPENESDFLMEQPFSSSESEQHCQLLLRTYLPSPSAGEAEKRIPLDHLQRLFEASLLSKFLQKDFHHRTIQLPSQNHFSSTRSVSPFFSKSNSLMSSHSHSSLLEEDFKLETICQLLNQLQLYLFSNSFATGAPQFLFSASNRCKPSPLPDNPSQAFAVIPCCSSSSTTSLSSSSMCDFSMVPDPENASSKHLFSRINVECIMEKDTQCLEQPLMQPLIAANSSRHLNGVSFDRSTSAGWTQVSQALWMYLRDTTQNPTATIDRLLQERSPSRLDCTRAICALAKPEFDLKERTRNSNSCSSTDEYDTTGTVQVSRITFCIGDILYPLLVALNTEPSSPFPVQISHSKITIAKKLKNSVLFGRGAVLFCASLIS